MQIEATTATPPATGADTIAVGVLEGEPPAWDSPDGALTAMVDSGEARPRHGHLAVAHAGALRLLAVGLGRREELDAARLRAAAHAALRRARELGSRALCWAVPDDADEVAAALACGSALSAYRFTAFRHDDEDEAGADRPDRLVVAARRDVADAVARAVAIAAAQNRARDLQNRPANDLTPTALAARARELAQAHPGLEIDVEGRAAIERRGMGALSAVAAGSGQEPALIVLRWAPAGARGPRLGLVGKAVTFDSGGLSIKAAAGMPDMKFDMSGGAAVLEAVGAIAQLGLMVDVVAVIGATENVISAAAMRPGDIVSAMDGTTIEVNNTDAEGRLVLADCLLRARELGAERLVDLATLTGGVVTALGSVHAGGFSNDEAWWRSVAAAAERADEPLWRLPLHERHAKAIRGRYADLTNTGRDRKAHPIMGAEFLHHFAGETPWAHLDIAGVASDCGLPELGKAGSGWGVRTLVELAGDLAEGDGPA